VSGGSESIREGSCDSDSTFTKFLCSFSGLLSWRIASSSRVNQNCKSWKNQVVKLEGGSKGFSLVGSSLDPLLTAKKVVLEKAFQGWKNKKKGPAAGIPGTGR
jgi:hypothetical protein